MQGFATDLQAQSARSEERMKTTQTEYRTDIALLGKQLAQAEARNAQRKTANTRWTAAAIAAAAALIVAAIEFL